MTTPRTRPTVWRRALAALGLRRSARATAATPPRRRVALGYHVLDTSRNRVKITTSPLDSEDAILTRQRRERIAETARDCERNFAMAAWAVRRHLDFVASLTFHCRAQDEGLRRDVETYIRDRERAENFDQAGRLDRLEWFRLFEARKVLDGDVFAVRLADGTVQAMEAETCRTPTTPADPYRDQSRWIDGVFTSTAGRHLAYGFSSKTSGAWKPDRVVDAAKVWHYAHRTRFGQTRGYSEILAGLATLLSTYETIDALVARARVEALFALALTRNADDAAGPITEIAAATEDGGQARYEVDFGKGPVLLDLEVGQDAKFLTTSSPGDSVQRFIGELIGICLKALDIPRSWWDSSIATFNGGRTDSLLYSRAAAEKRARLRRLHNEWADWQLSRAFANGDLLEPPNGLADVPYVWHAAGIPWWNPAQEVAADIDALNAKLTSRQRIVEERLGIDYLDLLDELATEEAAIQARFPGWQGYTPPARGPRPPDGGQPNDTPATPGESDETAGLRAAPATHSGPRPPDGGQPNDTPPNHPRRGDGRRIGRGLVARLARFAHETTP